VKHNTVNKAEVMGVNTAKSGLHGFCFTYPFAVNSSWQGGISLLWRHQRYLVSHLQYHSEQFPQDWLRKMVLLWLAWYCNRNIYCMKTRPNVFWYNLFYVKLFMNSPIGLIFLLPRLGATDYTRTVSLFHKNLITLQTSKSVCKTWTVW
jgi:hypothetical protein